MRHLACEILNEGVGLHPCEKIIKQTDLAGTNNNFEPFLKIALFPNSNFEPFLKIVVPTHPLPNLTPRLIYGILNIEGE